MGSQSRGCVEQDRDGVGAEVLYPSVGMLLCNHPDVDYKKACFDAYNQWMSQFVAAAPDRLIGLGQTALRSVEEGIADLETHRRPGAARRDAARVRRLLRRARRPQGDYDDPRWDPFWRAAVELKLPLSFHILTGSGNLGEAQFRGPKMNSFLGIIRGCQDVIGTMIFGGVFDRVPDLKVVCTEADAGWVPHWMYRADHAVERHRNWLGSGDLQRKPSEYFREHVYVTFQDDWVAFQTAHLMNCAATAVGQRPPAFGLDLPRVAAGARRADRASQRPTYATTSSGAIAPPCMDWRRHEREPVMSEL